MIDNRGSGAVCWVAVTLVLLLALCVAAVAVAVTAWTVAAVWP